MALDWIDKLQTVGGTKYAGPLRAVGLLAPKAALFLSDGEPEESADEILRLVRDQVRCPLHAVAVQTDAAAGDLLGKMAAATRGGLHRVEDPARLVDSFLGILGQIRRFRQYELTGPTLKLSDVQGEILAIGFERVPELSGAVSQSMTLSGSKIHVARAEFAARTMVSVAARGPGTRTLVIRFDAAAVRTRGWFVSRIPLAVVVRPTPAPLFKTHYLAAVRVGGVNASFAESLGASRSSQRRRGR